MILKFCPSSLACCQVVAAVAAEAETLPTGYVRYETMMVLRPNITDEERDRELAKFELFLKNDEAVEINAMVRGRQRMAYPMQGCVQIPFCSCCCRVPDGFWNFML